MVCFQWQQIRTDQQFGPMSQGTSINPGHTCDCNVLWKMAIGF